MTYKNYNLKNFDGRYDARYERVIDEGEILKSEGNWDLIMFDGLIYYIATAESKAASGYWGTAQHYYKMYGVRI